MLLQKIVFFVSLESLRYPFWRKDNKKNLLKKFKSSDPQVVNSSWRAVAFHWSHQHCLPHTFDNPTPPTDGGQHNSKRNNHHQWRPPTHWTTRPLSSRRGLNSECRRPLIGRRRLRGCRLIPSPLHPNEVVPLAADLERHSSFTLRLIVPFRCEPVGTAWHNYVQVARLTTTSTGQSVTSLSY